LIAIRVQPLLLAADHHQQLPAAVDERLESALTRTTEVAYGWGQGAVAHSAPGEPLRSGPHVY
jgi:hypothetical protein